MRIFDSVLIISKKFNFNTKDAFVQALEELNWSPSDKAVIKTDILNDLIDKVSYYCEGEYSCAQTHEAIVEVKHNGMFLVMFTTLNEHVTIEHR